MKKYILFLITLLFIVNSYSQKIQTFDYELLGAIVLDTDYLISYKIEFNANEKGVVQGYSYTDMGGENETKSYIRGHYNSKSKDIRFKENDILYTKSKHLPDEFCFVSFKGKFKNVSKKKSLNGNFIGIYDDKDTCATGKIKLVSTKFLEKKIKKLYKKVKKIKKIDSITKEKFKPKKYLTKFSETKIKPDENIAVFVYKSKLKVEVWDYGIQDGDVISIYNNDKPVIENLTVSIKKQTIYLELTNAQNLIKIKTISSGTLKTNTVKLKLYDFRREFEIVADLDEGKETTINIIKIKAKNK